MECSFGNSASFVLPETQKILAQCPKVRRVLFLPDFRPLECSNGRVECLTDKPWVFLQIRFSSEKPSEDIKLYLPPNEVLPKSSPGHMDSVLDTLVEIFCHKSGFFSLKIRKTVKHIFFGEKNPFVSKLFSGHMECGVDNSAKFFSPRNRQLLADCPKVKKFWFVPNYFPEVLRSAGHVESLPGSSSFSFEVFADAKVAYMTPVACPFSKNMEIFRQKAGKGLNLPFLEKRFNLLQKLLWSHGMQFWQHCQSYFAKNPNHSRSVPKKYESFVTSRN